MPVVRVHGVDVDWVQFPAARIQQKSPLLSGFFVFWLIYNLIWEKA
jgi:hypothetical protein